MSNQTSPRPIGLSDTLELWFVAGSQHLYGEETLRRVAEDAQRLCAALNEARTLPLPVVARPIVTTPDSIAKMAVDANSDDRCVGLMVWMHTFSPAKMWIRGLKTLRKPFLHFHTQFNRDIPWAEIDMDFMNLNQSAHGGREFGHIVSRMRIDRKVVVGHWSDAGAIAQIAAWVRAAMAHHDAQGGKIARFGDNMREVAVTEGDKVEVQLKLGYAVNGYGLGDLVAVMNAVPEAEVNRIVAEYDKRYAVVPALRKTGEQRAALVEAARIEAGLRAFLVDGGFKAFTTTFENLHGLPQLPGVAVQRLMADGFGFGAEGDWKHAALVRAAKVMATGLAGGTSFMEDYTYHFDPAQQLVLGAHMLEICPSIAAEAHPALEIHPLSIGGKADPVRLVFDVAAGPAVNASLVDLGDRLRFVVNEVDAVDAPQPLPKLPVARVLWQPKPSLAVAAAAWIYAGGAHHTVFSKALNTEHFEDFASMAGIEFVVIDADTNLRSLKNQLRWNDAAY